MKTKEFICDNISTNEYNELTFAGVSTKYLAEKYGTPLFLMDEDKIRDNCSTYVKGVKETFGDNAGVLYASKALSFKRIYEIMEEENMGIDVVSQGEIYTAKKAGFPLEKAYFHSNNKTDADITYALENNVGYFVVDNIEELNAISEIYLKHNKTAKILLRLTPGIDPHTYSEVATGKVDSKFGSAIETGQAEQITLSAISLKGIDLVGFHCHVGSQVFDSNVYIKTAEVMLNFIALIKNKYGFITKQLDLGGGFGVRYTNAQPILNISERIKEVGAFIKQKVNDLKVDMPKILFEPGRSIVANAGLTLYTVGTVKRITGYKNYVSIDGGMTDNPRYALYKSDYTLLPAYNMAIPCDMTASVVGRCCESGDIIQENVKMPETIKRGDIIACLTTGAYNYSMSSNYNRLTRPAVVMLKNKCDYIAVKRESLEDLTSLDV